VTRHVDAAQAANPVAGALKTAPASSAVAASPVEPQPRNPFVAHAIDPAQRRGIDGTVVERIAAGPYAYLRLREGNGREAWLVSLAATTPSAARVHALVLGRAERFHSRRLNRDFQPLLFAVVRAPAPYPSTQ
jgi:hypothetical protein